MLYESVIELKMSGRKLYKKHQDKPIVGKITSACICLKKLCCFCKFCCRKKVSKVSRIVEEPSPRIEPVKVKSKRKTYSPKQALDRIAELASSQEIGSSIKIVSERSYNLPKRKRPIISLNSMISDRDFSNYNVSRPQS